MSRWCLLALLAGAAPLSAQGVGIQLGRLFTDPSAGTYRLGSSVRLTGPLGAALHAVVVDSRTPIGNLWGAGADLSLFRSGDAGAYVVGGVEGGVATQGDHTFWSSWSAGLGYELFPLRGLSLAAEGRYRVINPDHHDGVEIGLRLALDHQRRTGGGGSDAPRNAAPEAEAIRTELGHEGVSGDNASRIGAVVQTALDVMGMPYRWGDEGEEGFDCSGLIRYAFSRQGINLPRRSVDQAREGTAVTRSVDQLRAGDILTFATSGKGVSHVGLYLGDGKFIHSATGGVQISVLSPDDVAGRWWWKRWVGARRVIG